MAAPYPIAAIAPKLDNILFGTDFSEESLRGLLWASGIARAFGAKMFLCHIQSGVPLSSGLAAPQLYEAVGKEAARHLDALRQQPALRGLELKLVLASGKIEDEMPKIIRENGIDLLVVGTHGRTGLSKMLLGSVVEGICRVATCPMLTVNHGTEVRPDAPFKHIFFSTNLSTLSKKALPYIALLARKYGSRVTVLHVIPEHEGAADKKGIIASTRETITNAFLPALADLQLEFLVAFGSTADTVLGMAREKQADLIALGIRNAFRPGILRERTAYRIMAGAPCPVLTVP